MKKRLINPKHFKIISYSLMAIILSIIVGLFTDFIVTKLIAASERFYTTSFVEHLINKGYLDESEAFVSDITPPEELTARLTKKQKLYEIQIIFILIVSIAVLSIMEIHISNALQKHQIIRNNYDSLTGLPNRQYFEAQASKVLKRNPNGKYIIFDCDVRGFKFINQKYGEKQANNLIIFLSKLLKAETDSHKGLIGRGFADRFYIMMQYKSVETATAEFEDHLRQFDEAIKKYEIPFFPVFGLTFRNGKTKENDTIKKLIGQASFAKARIKNSLVANYAVYDEKLMTKKNEEIYLEGHMEEALKNKEFFIMYQPKVDLKTDRIVGAEALVRWNNPKIGLIGPDNFIPLFERNGFITKLDFFVYEQVFTFIQNALDKGINVVPISLNMSRCHARPELFFHDFMELFNKFHIPAKYIEIEILERSVMDSENLKTIVDNLHANGFSVAMDDFGSGESSLNMLTKIPVDVLKFDREFLRSSSNENGELNPNSKDFIETLVNLGRNLKKQTLFEGVETENQRDFLRSIKCDLVQGYFYFKPIFDFEFLNKLEDGTLHLT